MQKSDEISPYIISFDTFMLQPVIKDNKMTTRIVERSKELTSPRKPLHLVRRSCHYYGNSYKSATNSAKLILSKSHKIPIVIAHDFGKPLVFLPTMSPNSEHNIWISLHAIDNVKANKMGCTIFLENKSSFKVNVSEATIHRQHTLGSVLKKKYQKKFRQLNRNLSPNFF